MKLSSPEEQLIFAEFVVEYINQKFDDLEELKRAERTVLMFAENCQLTSKEFINALNLASTGELINAHGEIVKYFRDINVANFNEYASSYIIYKRNNIQYEKGLETIKKLMNPPKPKMTPEERKELRKGVYIADYKRLQNDGKVMATTQYYEIIKYSGIQKVNLKFLESVLDKFKPETIIPQALLSRSKEPNQITIPKIIQHNAKNFFIDQFVHAYILKEKLKEKTELEWIAHWETLTESTTV